MVHVGIIGSGVSGLVCATRLNSLLRDAGVPLQMTVFEWGRGPGGRTARRRVQVEGVGEVSFDHAAPFFTATTEKFQQELLLPWEARGLVSRWGSSSIGAEQLWVGQPSNHAVCQGLAADLAAEGAQLAYGRHVSAANFVDGVWHVAATHRVAKPPVEESWEFDALVLSDKLLVLPNVYAVLPPSELGPLAFGLASSEDLPGGQRIASPADAKALPDQSPAVAADAQGEAFAASLRPQTTVVLLLAFVGPAVTAMRSAFGGGEVVLGAELCAALGSAGQACDLALVVRDSAKPGRNATAGGSSAELFVVHSTSEFATAHMVDDSGVGPTLDEPEAVREHLCRQFFAAANGLALSASAAPPGAWPEPAYASTMAWDHAGIVPSGRLPEPHRLDGLRRVGLCGDFFGGFSPPEGRAVSASDSAMGGVEAAALSGWSLAEALAEVLVAQQGVQASAASCAL